MKLFVAVLCSTLYFNIADCQSGLLLCIPQTGANGDDFLKIMSLQMPETRTEQCLKACIMKAMQTMGQDNKLNTSGSGPYLSKLQQKSPETYNKIMNILNECQNTNPPADECVAAYEYAKCINPKLKEIMP